MVTKSRMLTAALLVSLAAAQAAAQEAEQKADILFGKLEAAISRVDRELDGVMGLAILDLVSGRQILRNAEEVFPAASTIKIAVLAELYHQSQQASSGIAGKAHGHVHDEPVGPRG